MSDPGLTALIAHISAQSKTTEAEQAQLLVDLIAAEEVWKIALMATHGLTPYEHLASVHLHSTGRTFFRMRETEQRKFYADVRAGRLDEIAKLGVNFKFIAWSRSHTQPTASMSKLEKQIVALRHRLVESFLALIWKQSDAFKRGSKTKVATLADLISIGTVGVIHAVDKYVPDDGVVSVRKFTSVLLGRMSQEHTTAVNKHTVAHLYPKDERRLVNLRRGRVPETDVTDDDRQLLDIHITTVIAPRSAYDADDKNLTFDLPDPGLNPEEALIAKEEEQRLDALLASAPPDLLKAPRSRAGFVKHFVPVRDIDTGEVFPSITHAARALGCATSNICAALKNGRTCKGHRLERVNAK